MPRSAMRVLHAGHGDERDRPRPAPSARRRSDDPGPARGQPLPLHGLPQHRQGGAAGCCRDGQVKEHAMGANESGYIGQSVKRREDRRFLTGAGQYTDNVTLPRQTHSYFLRSPHAHAKIRSIDTSKAAKAPGVVAIFTGADLEGVGGLPCGWLIHSKDGTPMKEPPHPVLAQGKVRYVGDAVALIVAETYLQARDAAEAVDVDYEELPAVIDITKATSVGSAVHDDVPD